ncbi:enoyl-CoA hydratase/isomerase family protein [Sphingomonas arenae]|uniref:enoyl-CoA hydratase/isomerase family protein n=1 Tax=Sphingomonas arenae TaxID=2812555 RepID=UPI00196854C8|nr:enoyl-CoA hydratase/isomerase family protein [Sphingomonas arenae]
MSGDFRLDRDGPIAIITLDRPAKRNALTPESLVQLERLAEGFRDEPDTRAVIIRAEGEDFSVGADLSSVGGGAEPPAVVQLRRTARQGARLMRALQEIDQPTICAIQGIATGGATCIATACDFRIAAAGARIGYGEVKLGINLMWNALPLAVHLVGPARAKRLVMSGDLIEATILAEWGFIDEVVQRLALDEAALVMAQRYAALPPVAVQMIKRSVNALAGAIDQAVMHADADQWLLGTRTDDFAEALAAFRQKRAGQFTGN